MKKLFSLLLLCCACYFPAKAIDSLPPPRNIVLKVKVKTISTTEASGYLHQINDDQLYISPLAVPYNHPQASAKQQEFNYSHLSEVVVKRKGAAGRGLLFGLIGGAVTGAILGAAMGNSCSGDFCIEFSTATNLAGGALFGLLPGGLIGTLIGGLADKRYLIKGEKKNFNKMKVSLLERVYGNPSLRKVK